MVQFIDVYDYGAVGDGKTDDTKALQAAVDAAYETGRTLWLMPGRFLTGEIFLHPGICVRTDPQWGYRDSDCGHAVLIQRDADQRCILDVSEANGCTLDGLSLYGNNLPGGCCGILSRKTEYGPREDAYRIERCRVSGFSGHAVFLDHVWCFSVRHCMFSRCGGDGLRIDGWDGFVSDNWFSGNKGAGFGVGGDNCSVTFTANRVEWNEEAGIHLKGSTHYNITGNYIDRSGGPAIWIENGETITVTGNICYRSGKWADNDPRLSCHMLVELCRGLSVTGNVFRVGADDNAAGFISPKTGMRVERLRDTYLSGNTFYMASLEQMIDDRGGHGPGVVLEQNPGTVLPSTDGTVNRGVTIHDAIRSDPWNAGNEDFYWKY